MTECDKNSAPEDVQHVFCFEVSLYNEICADFAFPTHKNTSSIRLSPI
jgi:hypothetical protein